MAKAKVTEKTTKTIKLTLSRREARYLKTILGEIDTGWVSDISTEIYDVLGSAGVDDDPKLDISGSLRVRTT